MNADDDLDLSLLGAHAPPPPRRTDAAFARAVADDVAARNKRSMLWWLGAPALAVSVSVAAFVLWPQAPRPVSLKERNHDLVAIGAVAPAPVMLASADADPLLGDDDDGDDFAIPSLGGSSVDELLRLEKSLDAAIANQKL